MCTWINNKILSLYFLSSKVQEFNLGPAFPVIKSVAVKGTKLEKDAIDVSYYFRSQFHNPTLQGPECFGKNFKNTNWKYSSIILGIKEETN